MLRFDLGRTLVWVTKCDGCEDTGVWLARSGVVWVGPYVAPTIASHPEPSTRHGNVLQSFLILIFEVFVMAKSSLLSCL
jgi:hypothetical protein